MRTSPWERVSWLIPTVPVILLLLGARGCEAISCADVSEVTGRRTNFRLISGCYIEVNGKMIPRDSWRGEESR